MSSQLENSSVTPGVEPLALELRQVEFRNIVTDAAANSYRDSDELSDEGVEPLAEDMAANGLITPWLALAQPDGKYLAKDCHRRYRAVALNIKRGVRGFTPEMPIPVHVLPKETTELAATRRAVAANVQRQSLSDIGTIRAAVHLKRLGATNAEIGQTLGKSESTITRLVKLGTNSTWMQHVMDHHISFSTAIRLLQVGEETNRLPDLDNAFADWVRDTMVEIDAEDNRRRAADMGSLTMSDKWPQKCLKAAQVDTWIEQLRAGRPLGPPEFRFKALILEDGGPQRLEIDGVSLDLDALPLEDLAKIAGRIADLHDDLERAVREKHAAQQQVREAPADANRVRPSQRLWGELGLQRLIESASADTGEDSDSQRYPLAPEQAGLAALEQRLREADQNRAAASQNAPMGDLPPVTAIPK
ncbi:MAG: hypothetical protein ABSF26_19820 [Thermoguttaceae bacterium]|jgi:hypothetical protein